jgi:hypothetical protein
LIFKNDLDLEVTAGGDTTIKGKRGPHGEADYALFLEIRDSADPAEPFFYNTARAMQVEIADNITQAIEEVLK